MDDSQILFDMRKKYHTKLIELEKLKVNIEELEKDIQDRCTHDWKYDDSERGGRSWHVCHKCGKYR